MTVTPIHRVSDPLDPATWPRAARSRLLHAVLHDGARAHRNPRKDPDPVDTRPMETATPAHIDTAPSVPFDLAAVAARPLDLDTMARIVEDAGRAATSDSHVPPAAASPTLRDVIERPGIAPRLAASRLYRAAFRGALNPATD